MCITDTEVRAIVSDELSTHNARRDANFDAKFAPLKKNIDEINKLRSKIGWFFVGQIFFVFSLIFSAGVWYSSVNRQLMYVTENINRWNIEHKNEPSPYVLSERISQCQIDQSKTDKQLDVINAKLDRLLEKR